MFNKLTVMFFLLTLFASYSCMNENIKNDCNKIKKIEFYTFGISTINHPIQQTESHVRKNGIVGLIIEANRFEKIRSMIFKLKRSNSGNEYLGDIKGLCDIYCKNGTKYVFSYDGFNIKINDSFYKVNHDLIEELFFKKYDKTPR